MKDNGRCEAENESNRVKIDKIKYVSVGLISF